MTVREVVARAGKLLIQRERVFFNTWDPEEAAEWEAAGGKALPFYSEAELRYLAKRKVKPGWEVHVLGACDPVWVQDEEGNEVDMTRETLLALVREQASR